MIPFQLPPVSVDKHFPEDKTLNHILVFPLTFWWDWLLQSDMLLHGKKKIPFLKIKPLFSEKPKQLAFADSLHVLPMSGDGLSLTFPPSLYVVHVCFFRGLCFQCLCLVSHCLPYWLLYSFTSEFAAYFISVLHLHSACFAQLDLASRLYKDVPFFVILTSSALMLHWRDCRGQVKIIKTLK